MARKKEAFSDNTSQASREHRPLLLRRRLSFGIVFALLIAVPLLTFPYDALAIAPDQSGYCSTDRSQYSVGDPVTFICSVSPSGNYYMMIYLPDGSASYVDWGYMYAGYTYYVSGVAGYPIGFRTAIMFTSYGAAVATFYYSVGAPYPPGCPPNCPPIPTVTITTTSVVPFDFKISVANPTAVVQPGGQASYTMTVTTLTGTPQTVTLEVVGVPSGASSNLNPTSDKPSPTFSSVLTVTTGSAIQAGTYTISINAAGGGASKSTQVTLTVQGTTVPPTPTCPAGQHYDSQQAKCVDNATPPPAFSWEYVLIAVLAIAVAAVAIILVQRRGTHGGPTPSQGTNAWGSPAPPSPPPQQPRTGLVCPSCGFVNRPTARYCVRDRTPLNPSRTATYTPTRRK